MSFNNSFWNSPEVREMYEMDNAERMILHPFTATWVESLKPKTVLDYGCGDGYLATLLDPAIEISLFDKNSSSLKQVSENLSAGRFRYFHNEDQLPYNYFDCIVLSQVLMCIPSKEEIGRIAENIHQYKKPSGKLLIIVTHPCFLQYSFGHWYTSYSKNQPFNYLKEADPYTVYMKRPDMDPLTFTDYNWPLSSILNIFTNAGFRLSMVRELKDEHFKKDWAINKYYPHYLYLQFS